MKHAATRTDIGEYIYRGFVIFDTGSGRSVHDLINRGSMFRWRVLRKTGPGFFDREPTQFSARTYRDAKRRIDEALSSSHPSVKP